MDIDAEKFLRMQTRAVPFILFDLRTKEEFERAHIKGAFHLEAPKFLKELNKMVPQKTTPIVIYAESNQDLSVLVSKAEKEGFINIVYIEGGYEAYSNLKKGV